VDAFLEPGVSAGTPAAIGLPSPRVARPIDRVCQAGFLRDAKASVAERIK
jgi:hypothetical protein